MALRSVSLMIADAAVENYTKKTKKNRRLFVYTIEID